MQNSLKNTVSDKVIDKYTKIIIPFYEDLSANGRFEVKEAYQFDYSTVRNNEQLKKLLEIYIQRLIKAGIKINDYGRHGPKTTIREEIERAFFVVIDPKTNLGKLVLGDANQLTF